MSFWLLLVKAADVSTIQEGLLKGWSAALLGAALAVAVGAVLRPIWAFALLVVIPVGSAIDECGPPTRLSSDHIGMICESPTGNMTATLVVGCAIAITVGTALRRVLHGSALAPSPQAQ